MVSKPSFPDFFKLKLFVLERFPINEYPPKLPNGEKLHESKLNLSLISNDWIDLGKPFDEDQGEKVSKISLSTVPPREDLF